jgi:HEPN domain-containing protein
MSTHQTDADRWLKQANEDLTTAKILLEAERYGPCAFYCQQASEKALKAVLYAAGERPWGHSIPSLLDQACAVLGIGPAEAPAAEVEVLDEHYMRPRYPDA